MPYVQRDPNTLAVKGVYARLQPGYAEEFLAADDAEVLAFQNPPAPAPVLPENTPTTAADLEMALKSLPPGRALNDDDIIAAKRARP